jgi:hypothetical protein
MPNAGVAMLVLLYRLGLTRKTSLREYLAMALGQSNVVKLYCR